MRRGKEALMPIAHGSVPKFHVALTALALITGAMMFQALTVRQAKGAAAPAIAISPAGGERAGFRDARRRRGQ